MSWEPFTALMNAVSGVTGVAKPLIEEGIAHKNGNKEREDIDEWQDILGQPDSDERADRMHSFELRLCVDAGAPPGELSGRTARVPVEILNALTLGNIRLVRLKRDMEAATYALNKSK